MATILNDGISTGLYPLPETAPRLGNPTSAVNKIPAGIFELKPLPPLPLSIVKDLLGKNVGNTEIPPTYISPYDNFILNVTAIPTSPNELISGVTIQGPFACILEDPLPSLKLEDTLRSLNAQLRIGVSPWWAPGLFFEPFVETTPSPIIVPSPVTQGPPGIGPGSLSLTATIQGYYTDRNWTDREWILKYSDVIARFNINGMFTTPARNLKLPLNPLSIRTPQASAITPFTFFSTNILTSACAEEVMIPYLRCAEHIMSYKPSEIKIMRFYFMVVIDSVIYPPYTPPAAPPPSVILKTPFLCHMSVDVNHDWMSVFKLICSSKLVNGPCAKGARYEDLNLVPLQPEGNPEIASDCFTIENDFSNQITQINNFAETFINNNTIT